MNRIFKIVCNKTLGMKVVASEMTKSNGKKSLKVVVVVAMMAGVVQERGLCVLVMSAKLQHPLRHRKLSTL